MTAHNKAVVFRKAIRGITRVASNEWCREGITVNLISPIANSPGVESWAKAQPEYYNAVLIKSLLVASVIQNLILDHRGVLSF